MPEHTPSPTPTRGVYGFVVFLLFKTLFIIYVFWVYIPDWILKDYLMLTYLPDKYFGTFLPVLALVGVTLFAFLIYPALGLCMTLNINDPRTIRDEFSIVRCHSTKCLNKVVQSNNTWERNLYCEKHQNNLIKSEIIESSNEVLINGNKISKFCDCSVKSNCLLNESNQTYFDELKKRSSVPAVSDLDISDVCRNLFLNE